MSALNSASDPMSLSNSSILRLQQPKSSLKQFEDTQTLLTELFHHLKAHYECTNELHSFILNLAALLEMNALETATWWHLLKRYISPREELKTSLRLTGFHAKHLLTDKRDQYLAKLATEEGDFEGKYARWCSDSDVPRSFSLSDIHTTYAELLGRIRRSKTPKRIYKMRNGRQRAETDEETPRKKRKRHNRTATPPAIPIQPIPITPVPLELPSYDELEVLYFNVSVLLASAITPRNT